MARLCLQGLFILTLSCFVLYVHTSRSCPKKTTGSNCPSGRHTCTCPGDKKKVYFSISCEKTGWWSCGRPKHYTECGRYSLCYSCKNGVGASTTDVCTSCLNKGYTGGKCNTDVNECSKSNGGCGQECTNTVGSYYCVCNAGYSLAVNKHACDRKSCGRPAEQEGLTMVSVPIPGAGDFEFETSVEYSCSRLHHGIVGDPRQKCGVTSDTKGVEWHGQLPSCVVVCNASEHHDQCGVAGVDPVICDQLGCCVHDDLKTCHMRPGHIYLEYDGVRPIPTTGFKTPAISNVNECKTLCENDEGCESFALVQTKANITCYLYQYGRRDYLYQGFMRADPEATYYDPLFFEDDIDWREERAFVHRHFEYGCHNIETVEEYLPLVALKDYELLTSMKCADTCRSLGFYYSGVKLDECRCGKEIPSEENLFDDINSVQNETIQHLCTFNCTGDRGQFCGGEKMYTVQHVTYDSRYLGCYDDNIHHMPIRRWGRDANKTVEQCIQECARINFAYAGVQDGGACFCGPQFPMGAEVPLLMCDEPCVADKSYQWCGSNKYNSIYRTHAAFDLTNIKIAPHAVNLYHDEPTVKTIDTHIFTVFPQLRNFVTRKLIISASVPFLAPQQDHFCSSGECYSPCGSLDLGNQVIGEQKYVTFRQFVIRMSEIEKLLEGKTPTQVNIYAQAVYIDVDLKYNYALVIRARQVFIDRETSLYFQEMENATAIDLKGDNIERVAYDGLYPDLLFQRISYTCVRILTSTKKQSFVNIGFDIVNDLIAAPVADEEQEAMVRNARAVRAQMAGIDFINTHLVPLYNKNHLISILETYYTQISIYKTDFDRLQDSALLYEDFLTIAGKMNGIHKATVVNEALVSMKNIEEAYAEVTKLQEEIEKNYLKAADQVEVARKALMYDIEKEYEDAKKRAKWSFFSGLGGMILGAFKMDFGMIANSAGSVFGGKKKLQATYEQLAAMIAQIDIIMRESKEIMSGDNDIIKEKEGELVIDLQKMVSMNLNTIQWQVMKDYSNIVIADMDLETASSFRASMSEYCIWGEAFSQAMVDRAETLRQLLEKRAIYDLRKLQEERSEEVIRDAASSVDKRVEVMHVIQEQMLDVSLDLNNVLVQFCQAYFFENLKECREEYRPSFGGSMSNLLLKINAAKRDSLYSADLPSTVSRSAVVMNKNSTLTCDDPLLCPITCFNRDRFLVLTISPNDDDFNDIQKYRVQEVFLEFRNLNLTQEVFRMKFFLRNTGLFKDQRGMTFNFLTRPIHLGFEREVQNEGHVSIHADFPDDINQITPFTTWIIEISDKKGHLDLTKVDKIDIRFEGTGIV